MLPRQVVSDPSGITWNARRERSLRLLWIVRQWDNPSPDHGTEPTIAASKPSPPLCYKRNPFSGK
jgi:hypothetical protein